MLPLLTTNRFQKVMGSGRTQPCLLVCDNEAGEEIEVVAKLRGHPQMMPGGLLAEAVSSLLALDRFQGALEAIDEMRINTYLDAIPTEWNGPTTTGEKIKNYLIDCIGQFKNIRLQLETVL